MKSKSERIHLFFNELNGLAPASSIAEAMSQVKGVLDQVENEHSGYPYDIGNNWGKRMYLPPRSVGDAWKDTEDFWRVDLASNYFYFHIDGSMAFVRKRDAEVKWAKEGADSCLAPSVGSEHPDTDTRVSSKYDDYVPPEDNLAQRLHDYGEEEDLEVPDEPKAAKESFWSAIARILKK